MSSASTSAPPTAWPMVGGGARNTSVSDGPALAEGLGVAWRHQTEKQLFSPVVLNGTVYTVSEDGTLFALAADDGGEEWRISLGGEPTFPAVVQDTVLVGTKEGGLHAVSGGERVWQYEMEDEANTPPVFAGDTAYVGTLESTIHAVDVQTGKERWTADVGGSRVVAPVSVSGGWLFVGTNASGLHAFDVATGTEQWHYDKAGVMWSPPIVTGKGVLYSHGNGTAQVSLLDPPDGRVRWHHELQQAVVILAATDRTTVLTDPRRIIALDVATGKERWVMNLHNSKGFGSVAGDRFYLRIPGEIRSVGLNDGKIHERIKLDGDPSRYLAVADDRLFLTTGSGALYAIEGGQSRFSLPELGIGAGLTALGGYAVLKRFRG